MSTNSSVNIESIQVKDQTIKEFTENDAGDGTRREDLYLTGSRLFLCTLSIVFCLFLVGLDQTIVSTIINEVGSKFNALNKVGWLVSGFLLPTTVFAANWGQLSIIFGRKYCMIAAIIIFELGSLVCATAKNMNTLIGGRVLAGVGASGIQGLAFIIASEITPINKRPFIFAIFGLVLSISVVIGPLIGGALADDVTWRWCFYINLPIGAVATTFFVFTFNPPLPNFDLRTKFKLIDYLGTFLLVSGLTLTLLGFTFTSTGQFAWKSGAVISCLVLGVVLCGLFCFWNFRYSKHPIIPKPVVLAWGITISCLATMFGFGAFMAITVYLSLYFQLIFEKGPLASGVSILALINPTLLTSISTGIAIGKSRYVKPFNVAAGAFGVIGAGLMTLLDVDSSVGKRIGYVMLFGVSFGTMLQSTMAATQVCAPKVDGGVIMSTSFFLFSRGFGGSFSTIIADIVYNSSLKQKYTAAFNALPDGVLKNELQNFSINDLSSSSNILKTLSPDAYKFIKLQIMASIHNVFYFSLGLAGALFIATLFTSNSRIPAKHQVRTKDERDAMDLEKNNMEKNNMDKDNMEEDGNIIGGHILDKPLSKKSSS